MRLSKCPVLLLVVGLWLAVTPLRAMPIPPNPLWTLTQDAELIVVAEVTDHEPWRDERESADRSMSKTVALLSILDTLKGPELETVRVPYPAGLVCPQPPHYFDGEVVVAFLERYDDRWHTVSLSFGTLYPQGPDLDDVLTMTRWAVRLQAEAGAGGVLQEQRMRWLLEAAARSGTRWHALMELQHPELLVDRRPGAAEYRAPAALTDEDFAELAQALIREPRPDHTLPMMLELLREHPEPALDEVVLAVTEGMLAHEKPSFVLEWMLSEVMRRFGELEPRGTIERFQAAREAQDVPDWSERMPTIEEWRSFWIETKRRLGIPDVAPAEFDPERYESLVQRRHREELAEIEELLIRDIAEDGG